VAPAIETLYAAYKDKVEFFLIYIREAHPTEERAGGRPGRSAGVDVSQPRTADERALVAGDCLKALRLSLPTLVDGMDGAVEKAYGGWPAGTVILDVGGRVCFHSRGPSGAKPKEAEAILKQLLANGGRMPAAMEPAPTPPGPAPAAPAPPPAPGAAGKPSAAGPEGRPAASQPASRESRPAD